MKQDEVLLGGHYQTRVSGELAVVVVVQETQDSYSGRTKFRLQTKQGRPLPRLRAAAALRHTKGSLFVLGMVRAAEQIAKVREARS